MTYLKYFSFLAISYFLFFVSNGFSYDYSQILKAVPYEYKTMGGVNLYLLKEKGLFETAINVPQASEPKNYAKSEMGIDITKDVDGFILLVKGEELRLPNHPLHMLLRFVFPEALVMDDTLDKIRVRGLWIANGRFNKKVIYSKFQKAMDSKIRKYKGVEYLANQKSDFLNVCVYKNKWLIVGLEDSLKDSIDCLKGKKQSIKDNEDIYPKLSTIFEQDALLWLFHKVSSNHKTWLEKSDMFKTEKTIDYCYLYYSIQAESLIINKDCDNTYGARDLRDKLTKDVQAFKFLVNNFAPEKIKENYYSMLKDILVTNDDKLVTIKVFVSTDSMLKVINVRPKDYVKKE